MCFRRQVNVVLETPVPSNIKELQCLISRLAALGRFIVRFIVRFIDKLQHFFLIIKGANTFYWIDECKQTFEAIKCYLTEPPILNNLKSSKELYMHLVVSDCAVSVIMFRHI